MIAGPVRVLPQYSAGEGEGSDDKFSDDELNCILPGCWPAS
jgi:hypothetical protein